MNVYTVPEDMAHSLKVFTMLFLKERNIRKEVKNLTVPLKNFRLGLPNWNAVKAGVLEDDFMFNKLK